MTASLFPLAAPSGWLRWLLVWLTATLIAEAQTAEGSGSAGETATISDIAAAAEVSTIMDQTTSMAMLTDPMTTSMVTTPMDLATMTRTMMVDSSTGGNEFNSSRDGNMQMSNASLGMDMYLEYMEVDYSLLLPILPNATQVHLGMLVDER
jgi:hypothetical protein